jgi:hypothetical protein
MSRCAAIVTCPHCAWRARHAADTPGEIIDFLGRLRQQHLTEQHADQPVTEPEDVNVFDARAAWEPR